MLARGRDLSQRGAGTDIYNTIDKLLMNKLRSAPSKTSEMTQNHTETINYATALKNKKQPEITIPNMDQAIVLTTANEIWTEEYVYAVGDIIKPSNVIGAHKMSFDRMCIYLKSKDLANKFVEENPVIKIQNHDIQVRHLVKPAKRLIVSNVAIIIPHSIIISKLEELGFKMASPMKYLRAPLKNPEYAHVVCDRRQVYVEPTDEEIPETECIHFGENTYRIFISDTSLICNNCKKNGHKTEKCKSNQTKPNEQETQTQYMNIPEEKTQAQEQNQMNKTTEYLENQNGNNLKNTKNDELENKHEEKQMETENDSPYSPSQKRSAPSSSIESINEEKIIIETSQKKGKFGRARSLSPKNTENWIDEQMKNLKPEFDSNHFVLSFDLFKKFVEDTQKSDDVLAVARDYTDNIDDLLSMMNQLYTRANKTVKTKITLIIKKIDKLLEGEREH